LDYPIIEELNHQENKMNLNTLFKINTVVAGLFGIGFVIAPIAVMTPYGISQDGMEASVNMARWFGSANIIIALITWFLSNAPDSDAKTAAAKGMSIGFGIGAAVSILNQLSGEIGPLGWSTVAIFAIFQLAYGKFGYLNNQN
jgi:hypothetical protein